MSHLGAVEVLLLTALLTRLCLGCENITSNYTVRDITSNTSQTFNSCPTNSCTFVFVFKGNNSVLQNIYLRVTSASIVPFVVVDMSGLAAIHNITIEFDNISQTVTWCQWDEAQRILPLSCELPAIVSIGQCGGASLLEALNWSHISILMINVSLVFLPRTIEVESRRRGILQLKPAAAQCHNRTEIDVVVTNITGSRFDNFTATLFFIGCVGNDVSIADAKHYGVTMSNLKWDMRASQMRGTTFLIDRTAYDYHSSAALVNLLGMPTLVNTTMSFADCQFDFSLKVPNDSIDWSWAFSEPDFPLILFRLIGPPTPVVDALRVHFVRCGVVMICHSYTPANPATAAFVYLTSNIHIVRFSTVSLLLQADVDATEGIVENSFIAVDSSNVSIAAPPANAEVIVFVWSVEVSQTVVTIVNSNITIALRGMASKDQAFVSARVVEMWRTANSNISIERCSIVLDVQSGNIPGDATGANDSVLREWTREYNDTNIRANLSSVSAIAIHITSSPAGTTAVVMNSYVTIRVNNGTLYEVDRRLQFGSVLTFAFTAAVVEIDQATGLTCSIVDVQFNMLIGVSIVPKPFSFGCVVVFFSGAVMLGSNMTAITIQLRHVSTTTAWDATGVGYGNASVTPRILRHINSLVCSSDSQMIEQVAKSALPMFPFPPLAQTLGMENSSVEVSLCSLEARDMGLAVDVTSFPWLPPSTVQRTLVTMEQVTMPQFAKGSTAALLGLASSSATTTLRDCNITLHNLDEASVTGCPSNTVAALSAGCAIDLSGRSMVTLSDVKLSNGDKNASSTIPFIVLSGDARINLHRNVLFEGWSSVFRPMDAQRWSGQVVLSSCNGEGAAMWIDANRSSAPVTYHQLGVARMRNVKVPDDCADFFPSRTPSLTNMLSPTASLLLKRFVPVTRGIASAALLTPVAASIVLSSVSAVVPGIQVIGQRSAAQQQCDEYSGSNVLVPPLSDSLSNPFGVRIDALGDELMFAGGSVVSSLLLVLINVAVSVLGAPLLRRPREWLRRVREAPVATMRLPGSLFAPLALVLQPLITAAVVLVVSPFRSIKSIMFGILVLGLTMAPLCALLWRLFDGKRKQLLLWKVTPSKQNSHKRSPLHIAILFAEVVFRDRYECVPYSHMRVCVASQQHFERYGVVVASYAAGREWFVGVDIATSVVSGALSGFASGLDSSIVCSVAMVRSFNGALAALCCGLLVTVVGLRPYSSHFGNVQSCFSLLLTAASLALQSLSPDSPAIAAFTWTQCAIGVVPLLFLLLARVKIAPTFALRSTTLPPVELSLLITELSSQTLRTVDRRLAAIVKAICASKNKQMSK